MRLADPDQASVVEALAEIIPRHLREEFDGAVDGLCLNATRVGFEALRYFEIPSEPVVLSAIAANREWLEWRSRWDDEGEAAGPMPDESWSVGIGFGQNPTDGFDAHLALAVGDGGYLLCDFDAGQMARPERGIHIEPAIVVPWDRQAAWVDLPEGGAIAYGIHVERGAGLPRYQEAGGWKKSGKLAGPVIREARARLNSATIPAATPTRQEERDA